MKNLNLLIIAVACVAVGGALLYPVLSSYYEYQEEYEGPDAPRYDSRIRYTYEISDTFPGSGSWNTPDPGYTFLIVTFTMANDSYAQGLPTDWWSVVVKAEVNNVEYSRSIFDTADHVLYKDVKIMPGGQASSVCITEIPAGYTADQIDVRISFRDMGQWGDSMPSFEWDESLPIPTA